MRKLALLSVVVALTASGCQAWTGASAPTRPDEGGDLAARRASAIYSAVIRQLVTKDHTFGQQPTPFKRVFVIDGAVGVLTAGDPLVEPGRAPRPFSSVVKSEILEALRDLPPVRFVADPSTVIADEKACGCVRGGGVLISLGPIEKVRGDAVTVGTASSSRAKADNG